MTRRDDSDDFEQGVDEPGPPPPGFRKPTTWNAIVKAWSGRRAARRFKRARAYNNPKTVAKALGISRLPPSYLAYLERFETLARLWLRYARKNFPSDLIISFPEDLQRDRATFIELIDNFVDLGADIRKYRGLLPFGRDTSRTDICWDPARTKSNGEMAICFYNHEFERRLDLGWDLKEVVKYFEPGAHS